MPAPCPGPWTAASAIRTRCGARSGCATARLAIEHRGAFLYEVVDLDHGPVGCRRTWGGAEELAHQYADLRAAA